MSTNQEEHTNQDTPKSSNSPWKSIVGIVALMLVIGAFSTGRFSGQASGSEEPAMGCGGNPPPAVTANSTKNSNNISKSTSALEADPCPNATLAAATCTMTTEEAQVVYNGQTHTLKRLKVSVNGVNFALLGKWTDESDGSTQAYSTTQLLALDSSYGAIPLVTQANTKFTLTCKPSLSVKGELSQLPIIPGSKGFDLSKMGSVPKLDLGIKFGKQLKTDYPESPLAMCTPYMYIAISTADPFGVNPAAMEFMFAVDPSDPAYIIEVGGAPVEAATGELLSHMGNGISWNGKLEWTTSTKLPKGVKPENFSQKQHYTLKGHLYNRAAMSIPIPGDIGMTLDSSTFFDLSGLGTLAKATFETLNQKMQAKNLAGVAVDTMKKLNFGANVNSLTLDAMIFSIPLGKASLMRKNQVTRFAGKLKTPSAKAPKIFKDENHPVQKYVGDIFNSANATNKANIEMKGILVETSNPIRYRVAIDGYAKMLAGVSNEYKAFAEISNVDPNDSSKTVDLYALINTSINMGDFTSNVTSQSFNLNGKLVVNNSKIDYTLTGQTTMTIRNVNLADVQVTMKNSNGSLKSSQLTVAAKFNSPVANMNISGSVSSSSFSLTGAANVDLTPAGAAVTETLTKIRSGAETGWNCTSTTVSCGSYYVYETVKSIGKCISSIKCAKKKFGVCIKWRCKVKKNYSNCMRCTKSQPRSINLPKLNLRLNATIRDSNPPMSGSVSLNNKTISGSTPSFKSSSLKVCIRLPGSYIVNEAARILGLSTSVLSASSQEFCTPSLQ